jgi:hypothetical protein
MVTYVCHLCFYIVLLMKHGFHTHAQTDVFQTRCHLKNKTVTTFTALIQRNENYEEKCKKRVKRMVI